MKTARLFCRFKRWTFPLSSSVTFADCLVSPVVTYSYCQPTNCLVIVEGQSLSEEGTFFGKVYGHSPLSLTSARLNGKRYRHDHNATVPKVFLNLRKHFWKVKKRQIQWKMSLRRHSSTAKSFRASLKKNHDSDVDDGRTGHSDLPTKLSTWKCIDGKWKLMYGKTKHVLMVICTHLMWKWKLQNWFLCVFVFRL